MKKDIFIPMLPIVAAIFCIACSSPQEKIVEFPLADLSNTTTVFVSKVALTDSTTVLSVEARYIPHYWIRISSDSYLMADGRKYLMTGADGIKPDENFWMPESGKASFSLTFEPLPLRTRSFDFIESDCEDCFKIFGIDLTGKKEYSPAKGVPSRLMKTPKLDKPLPGPDFSVGETTVRVHLLNYRPELGKKIRFYVNTLLLGQQPYVADVDLQTGIAEFSFLQCGPARGTVVYNYCGGDVWLAPGEDADLYFDLRNTGWLSTVSAMEAVSDSMPYLRKQRFTYAAGKYGVMTDLSETGQKGLRFSIGPYYAGFADYDMTADEYTAHVISRYKAAADSIAKSGDPAMLKEFQMVNLKEKAVIAMADADMIRKQDYRSAHDRWDLRDDEIGPVESLGPEHYAQLCALFDINDPELLMGTWFSSFVDAVTKPDIDWPAIAGLDSGLVPELRKVSELSGKVQDAALTDEDFRMLEAMDNGFYLEAFSRLHAEAEKALAAVEGLSAIQPVPDVGNEELFDAIIAPYRGKVVLVDFWNTWCAPCRAAIESVEPMKEHELADDDMVWIYIANETSPLVKYKEMISGIKGIHYRLSPDRWGYLCDKFDIDGIPSYVLVDRSGKYSLRNDFRNHDTLKKTLSSMLDR